MQKFGSLKHAFRNRIHACLETFQASRNLFWKPETGDVSIMVATKEQTAEYLPAHGIKRRFIKLKTFKVEYRVNTHVELVGQFRELAMN